MTAVPSWLWIVFTIAASGAQTARNAMQRDLIATLGTAGATFVRFLYGLPFAVLFLGGVSLAFGFPPPAPDARAIAWTAMGAVSQILATGLMLAAMKEKSFVVAIAYTKTEPVLVALFGLLFLGDHVTRGLAAAIGVATFGVMLMSWPKKAEEGFAWRATFYGVVSAAMFALAAIGFRAGILALHAPNFVLGASTALALGLSIQSGLILIGLALFDRPGLVAILRAWRPSLAAGFLGALASQFWFLAFAIDTAARVRTLGLVEMIFAQVVTRRIFQQHTSAREIAGMAIMIAGVALLFWT